MILDQFNGMTTSDHRQADTGTSHESLEEREMYDTNYDVWEHEPSSKLNVGPWPISRLGEGLAEVLVLLTNNSISNPENDVELNLEIEVTESILAAMVSDEDRAIESLLDVTIVVPNNSIASSKDIVPLEETPKEYFETKQSEEKAHQDKTNKLPQKQITTLFPNSHLSVDNSIKNISPRGNKIFDNTALEHQSQRVSSFILDKRGQETCKDGGRSIREPELASKPKNLNARIHRGYGLASSCMCDGDMAKKDSKIIYYKAPSSFQNQKKLERENLEKWRIQIKERHGLRDWEEGRGAPMDEGGDYGSREEGQKHTDIRYSSVIESP
ncbi:unnamed protein product [Timema podura]|uniref:Uncharacterized protein n=1 Tax=Timema podura TaxID=61482 RepID=A0ABN7P1F4_TIMPD|nr:unnamed protein product [Timema podura]